jgi:hypothetical protein
MRLDHPAMGTLYGLTVLGALSCGGAATPPPKDYPVVHHPPAEVWYSPLYRAPAQPEGTAGGRIRVLAELVVVERENSSDSYVRHGLRVQMAGLRPSTGFGAQIEGDPDSVPFVSDRRGSASVLLGRSLADPGKRIVVADGSGNPVLLGAIPDWTRRPRGQPAREVYEASGGTVRVSAFSGSGRGRERLEFRFSGFPAGALLSIGGEAGIPFAGDRAILRWRSEDAAPLPLGAATVRELHGVPFEIRAGGGAVLVEGTIP